MSQVYSTALSEAIIRAHRNWSNMKPGAARTVAFLYFAQLCDREQKDILSVVEQLS